MKTKWLFLISVATFPALLGFMSSKNAKEGHELYKKRDYAHAIEKYEEALKKDPKNEALHFNLGNAYYQKNDFDKAQNFYSKALTSSKSKLQSSSIYSLGNCAFRSQKYEEALGLYQKAIELDPQDEEAKYNYEVTLKKLKKKQKEEEKQNQKNKMNQKKQKEQKEKSKKEQAKTELEKKQQKEQKKEDLKPQSQESQAKQKDKKNEQNENDKKLDSQGKSTEEGMKKDEVFQILNAVDNERKDLLLNFVKPRELHDKSLEKDW